MIRTNPDSALAQARDALSAIPAFSTVFPASTQASFASTVPAKSSATYQHVFARLSEQIGDSRNGQGRLLVHRALQARRALWARRERHHSTITLRDATSGTHAAIAGGG